MWWWFHIVRPPHSQGKIAEHEVSCVMYIANNIITAYLNQVPLFVLVWCILNSRWSTRSHLFVSSSSWLVVIFLASLLLLLLHWLREVGSSGRTWRRERRDLRYYLSKILYDDIEAGQKSESYLTLLRFKGIIYQKIQVRFENEIPFTWHNVLGGGSQIIKSIILQASRSKKYLK